MNLHVKSLMQASISIGTDLHLSFSALHTTSPNRRIPYKAHAEPSCVQTYVSNSTLTPSSLFRNSKIPISVPLLATSHHISSPSSSNPEFPPLRESLTPLKALAPGSKSSKSRRNRRSSISINSISKSKTVIRSMQDDSLKVSNTDSSGEFDDFEGMHDMDGRKISYGRATSSSSSTSSRKSRRGILNAADLNIRNEDQWEYKPDARLNDTYDKPFRFYNEKKYYLDELDIISLLDQHDHLKALDPLSYNAAAYFWKKFSDIPEVRRVRLLEILEKRHLKFLWNISRTKYDLSETFIPDANFFLPDPFNRENFKPEVWEGLVFGIPSPFQSLNRFQKIFFVGSDGLRYGRVTISHPWLTPIANKLTPLYLNVRVAKEVLATGELCDAAFRYNDGHLNLNDMDLPPNFPEAKPPPIFFKDGLCDYVRSIGPNILIGQSWIEGNEIEKPPTKFLTEFILIKNVELSPS